jgi:hypothetical protein
VTDAQVHRRTLLAGGMASAGVLLAGPAAAQTSGLRQAARDAYIFGLPLLEFARVRAGTLATGLKPNTFQHRAALADHTARQVTTPNNDTVYSSAFLDLRGGPVTLTLPPSGPRYLSVALMDAYTNNFAVLGTRTTGVRGGRHVIVGPGATPPPGAIVSPTPWVWALGRVLVDGPADLAAAGAVQRGLTLGGGAPGPAPTPPGVSRDGDALAVLTAIHRLIAENPPRPHELATVARLRPALMDYTTVRLTADATAALRAGVEEGRALLQTGGGIGAGAPVQGWTYPRANLGDFGTDYVYRAGVAVNGLAALPNAEAMYMRPVGPDGRSVFAGGSAYRLRFRPGQLPPVRRPGGFWSLTMYEVDPAGQLWLVDNPLRRYAIGDRTPGLVRGRGGALDILIGANDPGPALRANWLPAPRGPWTVVMRTYLPGPSLLRGRYGLPQLVQT